MKYEEVSWYSYRINRKMNIKVYGHFGLPIIVFPSFNKGSDEFYHTGTLDALSPLIEDGKIKLFCLDSNDSDTVASFNSDFGYRTFMLKMYYQYVLEEVLPFVYNRQGGYSEPLVLGASMGATHAATVFFNHPELFCGILALSGGYDLKRFFFGYMDEDLYFSSPVHFMGGMNNDNPLIGIYNSKRMILACGSGSFEHLVLHANYELKNSLNRLGVNAWFDIYGSEFVHDWCSWNYFFRKYLDFFI